MKTLSQRHHFRDDGGHIGDLHRTYCGLRVTNPGFKIPTVQKAEDINDDVQKAFFTEAAKLDKSSLQPAQADEASLLIDDAAELCYRISPHQLQLDHSWDHQR